jgi:hypothetical protein
MEYSYKLNATSHKRKAKDGMLADVVFACSLQLAACSCLHVFRFTFHDSLAACRRAAVFTIHALTISLKRST